MNWCLHNLAHPLASCTVSILEDTVWQERVSSRKSLHHLVLVTPAGPSPYSPVGACCRNKPQQHSCGHTRRGRAGGAL